MVMDWGWASQSMASLWTRWTEPCATDVRSMYRTFWRGRPINRSG